MSLAERLADFRKRYLMQLSEADLGLLQEVKDLLAAPIANSGHGHVYPRTDGVKARCGGPGVCSLCATDLARKQSRG